MSRRMPGSRSVTRLSRAVDRSDTSSWAATTKPGRISGWDRGGTSLLARSAQGNFPDPRRKPGLPPLARHRRVPVSFVHQVRPMSLSVSPTVIPVPHSPASAIWCRLRAEDRSPDTWTKLPNPCLPANCLTPEEQPVAEPLYYGRWSVSVYEALRHHLRTATQDDICLTVLKGFSRVSRCLSRRTRALIHAG